MVLDECWKPIYFGIKKSKVTSHKNIASVGLCTLVSAGFLLVTAVYILVLVIGTLLLKYLYQTCF